MSIRKYLVVALLVLASGRAGRAQFTAPTPTAGPRPSATPRAMSAREHARELAQAEALLRGSEDGARRSFNPLRDLENPRSVKRADGETAEVEGREWEQRRLDAIDPSGDGKNLVTRREVRGARESVAARREALETWAFPPRGKYFQPDLEAKAAIQNWEKSGAIQTGPPEWQKWWLSFVRSAYDLMDEFTSWLDGLFKRSSNVKPVKVDTGKAEIFFYILLAGILGGAAYLTWRALGGRGWVRRGKGARDVILEGEDAALLRLPPDELLDRAARFAREGNFREALRHRYLSLLLLLDARGVWRYDRRRTNWEHLARLRASSAPRAGVEALSSLTLRFDRVRYGNEECDAPAWQRFDDEAHQVLAMLSGSGASSSTWRQAEAAASPARREVRP